MHNVNTHKLLNFKFMYWQKEVLTNFSMHKLKQYMIAVKT